jgi:hypothetical protein
VRIAAHFHENCRGPIDEWIGSLAVPPEEQAAWAEFLLTVMVEEIIRSGGVPEGATRVRGRVPPTYWWQYSGDVWVQIVVREFPAGWFRRLFSGSWRDVTIYRFQTHPPDPAS